jgi:N-acetylneuraminic acid mutarotase
LLAGGLLAGDVSTARTYRVDPRTGIVHAAASLRIPAHDVAGAALHGAPVLFGGGGANELSVVQRLGPDGHWHVIGSLPGPRSDLSAVAAGQSVLVVGGYDGASTPRAVLRTADGRHYRAVGRLPVGVRYASMAGDGRTAWVIGGEVAGQELDRVFRLDLRTGRVHAAGRMPVATGHAAAVMVGGRILVLGGRTSPSRPTAAMWWFDPARRTWHRAGRLPYPVADAPLLVRGRHAYLLGGETPGFTARVTVVRW